MKKYILSVLSIAFLGLTSCTEDIMDDINKDNQHPSPENVSAALQLTDAIMATVKEKMELFGSVGKAD